MDLSEQNIEVWKDKVSPALIKSLFGRGYDAGEASALLLGASASTLSAHAMGSGLSKEEFLKMARSWANVYQEICQRMWEQGKQSGIEYP